MQRLTLRTRSVSDLSNPNPMKALALILGCVSAAALAFAQQNPRPATSARPHAGADEAAIRAASKAFEQGSNRKDWPAAMAHFSDDAVFMAPNLPAKTGRKEIEAMLKAYPPFRDLRIEPVELEIHGDVAWVRGRYSYVAVNAPNPDQTDTGKYMEVWRKTGSAWKYARGIFNSDLPPPAVPLSPADVAALREVNETFRRHVLAQAWSEWANLFTADAVVMPPNSPPVVGRPKIEAWGRAYPRFKEFENPIAEIEGSGDFAVTRGTYKLLLAPPDQTEQADSGKYIATWRKQTDGSWKLHRDIFNSDEPAAAETKLSVN